MNNTPPILPQRLLGWFLKDELAEEVLGDLEEKFLVTTQQRSAFRAKINYWYQVLNYIRPFAIKNEWSNSNNFIMYSNYLKIGFRNLRKNRGYSFINIGGLALGITATLLISLWVYDEISFNTSHRNYDRVAQVVQNVHNNGTIETWFNMPWPLSEELRSNYRENFDKVAMSVGPNSGNYHYEGNVVGLNGISIERDGADILDVEMVSGVKSSDDPATTIISESAAKALFGDDEPINKVVTVGDGEMPPIKVVGVYKDFPTNSRFSGIQSIGTFQYLYDNIAWYKEESDPWRPNFVTLLVQIVDGKSFEEVSANIRDAKKKKIPQHLANKNPELFLHPMQDWYLRSQFENGHNVGGRIQYVWLFGVVALFVLSIACINFMNLNTARNEQRAKEVGIRKTIGSVRSQLIAQFLTESILIVATSFTIAIAFTTAILPYFNSMVIKDLSMPWDNPSFWGLAFIFILCVGIVSGSYPAFYLSSFKPVKVLKGMVKNGASLPRKILVVIQFTVSIALIIGTITVYNQIRYAKDRSIGYDRDRLIYIHNFSNELIHNHIDAFKDEIISSGAAVAAAESQAATTRTWATTSGLVWEGKNPDESIDFGFLRSDFDYGNTINWNIIEGRDFDPDMASDSAGMVINQAAKEYMGIDNVIGSSVKWWDDEYKIIGVIENIISQSPYEESKPMIYFTGRESGNVLLVRLNPERSVHDNLAIIESTFKKYNSADPFDFEFIDDEYNAKFGAEERIGHISTIFAVFAILISCLGIFALSAFTAERRAKEIGIRKVMGASVNKLWQLLTKEFVKLVMMGGFIAIPISYYFTNQWLENYTYHTGIHWTVYMVAALLTLLVTVVTVSYQSIKAAMVNPVKSLRSE